jgi:hypothetical protein
LKAENDVFFGNSSLYEFASDSQFSIILLYPNFAFDNVEMERTTMHAPIAIPADIYDLISILLWRGCANAFFVEYEFGFDFAMRKGN